MFHHSIRARTPPVPGTIPSQPVSQSTSPGLSRAERYMGRSNSWYAPSISVKVRRERRIWEVIEAVEEAGREGGATLAHDRAHARSSIRRERDRNLKEPPRSPDAVVQTSPFRSIAETALKRESICARVDKGKTLNPRSSEPRKNGKDCRQARSSCRRCEHPMTPTHVYSAITQAALASETVSTMLYDCESVAAQL